MVASFSYTNLIVLITMIMMAFIVSAAPAFSKKGATPSTETVTFVKRLDTHILDNTDLGDSDLDLDDAFGDIPDGLDLGLDRRDTAYTSSN